MRAAQYRARKQLRAAAILCALALAAAGCASTSNGDGNASFCESHACIDNFDNGDGYKVQCADGTWSHSGGKSGACSWHGGVSGP
jgi:hypothetical protein